jgi:dienelactone hydrolase
MFPGKGGLFVWAGRLLNTKPAPAGTYDVRVELIDEMGLTLSLPGYTTSAQQIGAITIDRLDARIDRKLSTQWVLVTAAGPANPVAIKYEVVTPFAPDDVRVRISSATAAPFQVDVPIPILPVMDGTVFWDAIASPGEYLAQVVVLFRGAIVAQSDPHEIHLLSDPNAVGPFPVGEHEYNDGPFPLPAGDGYAAGVTAQLRAIVRYPAAMAGVDTAVNAGLMRYPLVLIVHGNHRPRKPRVPPPGTVPVESYKGFDYLARHLASHGIIAASLDMDVLNGAAYPSIDYRAQVTVRHITGWSTKNMSNPIFMGKVDTARIGLVGHSRGAEAVVRARILDGSTNIKGVVSISPTDFIGNNLTSCPYLMIYGSSDADVFLASGFKLYDRAARPKAQVYVYGAMHNGFCKNDDWGLETAGDARLLDLADPLGKTAHGQVAMAFSTAFFRTLFFSRIEDMHYMTGEQTPPALAGITVVQSYADGNFRGLDSFPVATPMLAVNDMGGAVAADPSGSLSPFEADSLGFTFPPAFAMDTPYFQQDDSTAAGYFGWIASAAAYKSDLPNLDISAYRFLSFRVAQALTGAPPADVRNPPGLEKKFHVTLTDADLRTATVPAGSFVTIPYPFVRSDVPVPTSGIAGYATDQFSKSAFTSVRIPMWAFLSAQPEMDFTRIRSVRFVFDDDPAGLIAIDDVEVSS